MTGERQHPKYKLPDEPHARYRYESAIKHVEAAKKAGKSSEEIHEVFRKVMAFDPGKDLDKLPQDEAHQKYRSAVVHLRKAIDNGKSSAEAHQIYHNIITGNTQGHAAKK